jgi:hypothetical protein
VVTVVAMILAADTNPFQVTVTYLTVRASSCFCFDFPGITCALVLLCSMHRTLVPFLEFQHSFLNNKEQNSSSEDNLSASKVSPSLFIYLKFLLMV